MDLWCTRCGEPWDIHHVLHDAEPDDFTREGGAIFKCPACPADESEISPGMKRRAGLAAVLASVLGDDIDGMAAELEDLEGLG